MQKKPLVMRPPFYRKGLYDKFSLCSEKTDTHHSKQQFPAFGETPLTIY